MRAGWRVRENGVEAPVAGTLPSQLLSPLPSPLSPILFGSVMFSYLAATLILGSGILAAWAWKVPPSGIVLSLARQDALRNPSEIVGQITKISGCRWVDPAAAPANGAYVHVGRKFALSAGQLEITYTSAYAKVLLQGPAEFTVDRR